jgi:hypothetical protein
VSGRAYLSTKRKTKKISNFRMIPIQFWRSDLSMRAEEMLSIDDVSTPSSSVRGCCEWIMSNGLRDFEELLI